MLQFKLVLLGDSSVGKSSIVNRFVKDSFDELRESTIGAAFLSQTITLKNKTVIKFEIWDTAGQERYKSLAPMYYRNANAALVVYDITENDSLMKAQSWVDELKSKVGDENLVICLVGNKIDLCDEDESKRVVLTKDAKDYADEQNLMFYEVSAKSGENVKEVFQVIGEKLYEDKILQDKANTESQSNSGLNSSNNGGSNNDNNINLNNRPSTNNQSSSCC
ncbi:hypothetical protein TBLA_0C02780 [Henningerozyma blattae CBS 6284]|uniref:GTP-binding protein YPT52 n=1 Tax=Henningerozyma blattae (strain ATCC 34711 / CBS 6284 / DSM 70876 / NBRC 10599 / NRRL Y-10934 / UCD 77-7) TaxID=1071380 RepID=I2H133_HENB6|nr:hypothetical protein TBLA_0C02780 [Tetrapisispora blattae CBS 6284]CCH60085.1 hypothetical protein TBLA_0C02780 [Tetrapisispora blattae CBS 6284]